MRDESTFRAVAVLENVPKAVDFVADRASAAGLDSKAVYQIQVAVDEACANVVHHAYAGLEPGDMEVTCRLDGQVFVIRVRNWGRSFDPEGIADPDVDAALEDRALGGLGLFFIDQFMDHVEFIFSPESGNELVMTKRLHDAE